MKREEVRANANPDGYRKRVMLLAALGFSYIFGVLLLWLVFVGFLIYMMVSSGSGSAAGGKLVIVGGIFIVTILRSLYVKFEDVGGLKLARSDAPQLYAEVDAIADRLKAPRVDEIRINEDLNAAAVQRPKLGIFGWYENTLLLGLPLLLSLEPDEARAVIAHEFGHFSGAHGKFGARIYRLNRTWATLRENLARQGRGAWLFAPFFNWFQPRFAATTFALRRANEYQADQAAASLYGANSIASALMRLPSIETHLRESFWDPYYEQVKTLPHPPKQGFVSMPQAAASATDPAIVEKNLWRELSAKTDYDDTHPSLTDRFKSLGIGQVDLKSEVARLSNPVDETAASALLRDRLPAVLSWVEAEHAKEIGPRWAEQYRNNQEMAAELAELEAKPERTITEEVDRAYYVYQLRTEAEAEPMFRQVLEKQPQNATALFWLSAILLDKDDATGIPMAQQAMRLNHQFSQSALQRIAAFHHRRGDHQAVETLRDTAIEVMTESQVTGEEAMRLKLEDLMEPPSEVAPEILAGMKALVATRKEVGRAYLVRKVLPGRTRTTRLILVALLKSGKLMSEATPGIVTKALANEIESPERMTILVYKSSKPWVERLDGIRGSLIYDSKEKPV